MHWKITQPNPPKAGDTKTVTRRAWWPHSIGEMRIWLEQYSILYVYEVRVVDLNEMKDDKPLQAKVGQWIKVIEKPVKWQRVA